MWLTVAPCDDGGVQIINTSQKTHVIKDDTDDKTENDFDSCTFFCLCNCCGAIFILSSVDILCPPWSLSEKKFALSEGTPFYMNFPLLRPPKALLS